MRGSADLLGLPPDAIIHVYASDGTMVLGPERVGDISPYRLAVLGTGGFDVVPDRPIGRLRGVLFDLRRVISQARAAHEVWIASKPWRRGWRD